MCLGDLPAGEDCVHQLEHARAGANMAVGLMLPSGM